MLPAYSVEYFSIQLGPISALEDNLEVEGTNEIKITSEFDISEVPEMGISVSITLNYHGIRDYSMLFPWINNSCLRERLGLFYEECEKNFEQGSWLSFSLMCGAIFEGILYAKLEMPNSNNTFKKMIDEAFVNELINDSQKEIMDKVRNLRNLVHGNNYRISYVSRKDAMDIRNTLDKLIKSFGS